MPSSPWCGSTAPRSAPCWQASPASTLCDSLSLAQALGAAIDSRADIVNLSLGGPPDELLARLLLKARERSVLTVAAGAEEGEVISHPWVTGAISQAQKRVELQNF